VQPIVVSEKNSIGGGKKRGRGPERGRRQVDFTKDYSKKRNLIEGGS